MSVTPYLRITPEAPIDELMLPLFAAAMMMLRLISRATLPPILLSRMMLLRRLITPFFAPPAPLREALSCHVTAMLR